MTELINYFQNVLLECNIDITEPMSLIWLLFGAFIFLFSFEFVLELIRVFMSFGKKL